MNYHILGRGGFSNELVASIRGRGNFNGIDEFYFYEDDVNSTAVDKLTERCKPYGGEILMGVGNPQLKKRWNEEINLKWIPKNRWVHGMASFVFPGHLGGTILDLDNVSFGESFIMCHGSILTTNIEIGDFVTLNLNTTVGHDVKIGSFTTASPGCHINGHAEIGECVELGSGVVINPHVKLPPNGIIGAGSCVVKSPDLNPWDDVQSYLMVGSPAKLIKVNNERVA